MGFDRALEDKIEKAFSNRARPLIVCDSDPLYPDVDDAFHFEGASWQQISDEEWNTYSDALFHFTDEAWAYYIQSILILKIRSQQTTNNACHIFISFFDISLNPDEWTDDVNKKLKILDCAELEVIREWFLYLSEEEFVWDNHRERAVAALDYTISKNC